MAVITISKEFATDSQEVAAKLAAKLGYEYIGKRLVSEIAKELSISESEAETFRKTHQTRMLRFLDRYTCSIVQRVVGREYSCLDDKKYFEVTKKLVENLYDADNVIILGWGGQCILRGKPKAFHVRLIRDMDSKIKKVMERFKVDEKKARDIIDREEKDSREYIKHFFKANWNDPALYDLVIDMGNISVNEAVNQIIEGVKKKVGI
ncbi:MAG TPA: cytidylate kinase-like family protein [Deltaproteobacteria bacterium]|nr:cytidylate kinase-like family protein [Deltaproteobacteria bacterium]